MGQLMLDKVRAEPQDLIEYGSCYSPEAVTAHFLFADTHAAHCCKHGIFAHRSLASPRSWKDKLSLPGERLKFAQNLYSQSAEGNDVRLSVFVTV